MFFYAASRKNLISKPILPYHRPAYDGAFFMDDGSGKDSIFVKYKCDDGAVIISDIDGNILEVLGS